MLRVFTRPLVRWLFGTIVAAALIAPACEDLATILREQSPAQMTCAEFARARSPRWVALTDCRVDGTSIIVRSTGFTRTRHERYGRIADTNLWVALDSFPAEALDSGRLEGIINPSLLETPPPQLASTGAPVLHGDRPSTLVFGVAALTAGLYGLLVVRRIRTSRVERALRAALRDEAASAGAASPARWTIDVTPLVRFDRRMWFLAGWWMAIGFVAGAPAFAWIGGNALPAAAAAVVASIVLWVMWRRWRRQTPVVRWWSAVAILMTATAATAVASSGAIGRGVPLALAILAIACPLPPALSLFTLVRSRQGRDLVEIDRVLRTTRRVPGRTRRSKRAGTKVLLRIASILSAVLGFAFAALIAQFTGGHLFLVLAALALVLPVRLWHRAQRHGLLAADEVLREDSRPPVLLLRSFTDDSLAIERPALAFVLPEDLPRAAAALLNSVGPVVALASPQEKLAPVGPARIRSAAEDWRATVERLMASASTVIAVIGDTPGLLWEAERLLETDALPRTCWLVPPCDIEQLRGRWAAFCRSVANEPSLAAARSVDPNTALALFVSRSRRLAVISANERSQHAYEAALAAFIADREGRDPAPASEPHRR